MKIAFDAKRITHNATGLGNYSRYIANMLAVHYPENSYLLYTPGKGKEGLRTRLAPHGSVSFRYPQGFLHTLLPSLWRSSGIIADLKREKIDLYHGLSNELPYQISESGIPSVVTIHDLIFLRFPQFYKLADRMIYTRKFRTAAEEADRVIAISEQTRRDIHAYFQIPESKIDVIYQGCHPVFYQPVSEAAKEAVRARYGLTSPYILYVGSMEERKNLLLLIEALRGLKEDIQLVAIGKRTPYAEKVETYIRENRMEGRVHLLNEISFGELPAFYQMADLFVYPSLFEGFGIPIIEALLSGVPVIAATGSCLEEAGGPDSLYTDPHKPDELRALIESVLRETGLARKMRENGLAYARRFDEAKLAGQLMEVYRQVAK